jgi:predicted RNase H-like HicB family nuclease
MRPKFYVWTKWDDEAGGWYTAETSIPGLNSSGDTLEELRERLILVIPDFLEDQMPANAVLHIIADREDELTPIAAE